MAANAKTAEAPRRSPGQMLGTMGRVLGYMVKRYKFSCLMVVVCILGSATGVGAGRAVYPKA